MPAFKKLAIPDPAALVYGKAPKPLKTRRGMVIGGGEIYPELNFTLPPMLVNQSTMEQVRAEYKMMITGALERAAELAPPGLVVEFETLPPMTEYPDWGMDIVNILLDAMEDAHAGRGLKSVLRVTPNDNREMVRPPKMRSGFYWDGMVELFERSAAAGAELLSIESVGGKELHDEALTMGDLPMAIFSLCVMGSRDMRFLWKHIADIANKHHVHPAGDTACGFANTAMVLAHQKMIPSVFAAVIRAVSAVRSLVAYEMGAVGPGKDCGYENPILKAITGYPMAMEGKCAACAHLSTMGNLAAATADTWSNESVQNVKLLGGMAPTVSMEQLIFDCRLMNEASRRGEKERLFMRDLLVCSDAGLDAQAYIISPESSVRLAKAIVASDSDYHAGKNAALEAIKILTEGHETGCLKIAEREVCWLDTMKESVEEMPDDEERFINSAMAMADTSKFVPEDYELAAV